MAELCVVIADRSELRPGATMLAAAAAAGLCMGSLSTLDVRAQSLVLECSIGGQERSEVRIVDPAHKSINIGRRTIPAEVTAQTITWKEDGIIRMIDRSTGAVLHRLPDESYFHIGQCRPSKGKF
jgi:hypothetical protein